LAAAQRLRRRGEFAATVRGGRRAGRGAVVVHLMLPAAPATPESTATPTTTPVRIDLADPATSLGASGARAGFVVPKSVGGAVVRNKVKRRLRHLIRARLADLPAGTDLVIRALPGAASRSYPEISSDLDAALGAARRGKRTQR
jgi:ribonuclease P protein component